MSDEPFDMPAFDRGNGCVLRLHVVPRSSKTTVVGLYDSRVKVRVAAPPVDGKANAEIVAWLAKSLSVSRSDVDIRGGATAKRKSVHIDGLSAATALARLGLTP